MAGEVFYVPRAGEVQAGRAAFVAVLPAMVVWDQTENEGKASTLIAEKVKFHLNHL